MSRRVWGIKLGSGGRCVAFCEQHQIVGVGWKSVDVKVVERSTRGDLWSHVKETCPFYSESREIGKATGQLFRFGRECQDEDYVLYYHPARKSVRICRVKSVAKYRDFDLADPTDIWHYRRVECPIDPIPILDLPGRLKGRLLGPRMSFWEISGAFDFVDRLVRGESTHDIAAPDPELKEAYSSLRKLVARRAAELNDGEWECLVADYMRSLGAEVDERHVGGNRPVIDVEARFHHGEFIEEVWRLQVKRYQDRRVDWPEIERDFHNSGTSNFCFVSVFGFTEEARQRAGDEIILLEAEDFVPFLISGKLRKQLRNKLRLPTWAR